MAKTFIYTTLLCIAGLVSSTSADPSYVPSYVYPAEHRSNLRSLQEESTDPADYEFQIVPSEQYDDAQYAVSQYDPPAVSLSVWDLLPSPITCIATVGKAVAVGIVGIISKALVVVKVIIAKTIWMVLGAGIVVGFCAFTPYCTLTIHKPFARELKIIGQNIPYLDEIESFFYQAYDKIHGIYGQN